MNRKKSDITILGGGPGGYSAALTASKYFNRVVLVEKEKIGGTCLNVGCIPTKALYHAAKLYKQSLNFQQFGIEYDNINFNFNKISKYKQSSVNMLTMGVEKLLNEKNVEIIKGKGKLVDKNNVEVLLTNGEILNIKSESIIIATGSKEIEIPYFAFDGINILSSTDILDLNTLPESLAIIGGGIIGVEFASIFSMFGVDIHVIEILPSLIYNEEPETKEALEWSLKNCGVKVHTNAKAIKYEKTNGQLSILIESNNNEETIRCQKILVCTGRKSNIDDTGFKELGGLIKENRIVTDRKMKTNIDGIYAVGDVTSSEQLAHIAYQESRIAVLSILNKDAEMNYSSVPRCIFSNPEIASVGLSESKAVKLCKNIGVEKFNLQWNGKALIEKNEGFVKIIYNKNNNKLLGATVVGNKSTEIIGQFTLAIRNNLSLEDIAKTIQGHPTLSESISEVTLAAMGLNLHS